MPISARYLIKSREQARSIDEQPFVPNYAVLFWHAPDGYWGKTTTAHGRLLESTSLPQYYRQFSTVSVNPVYTTSLKSYPLIKCVTEDAGWKELTGYLEEGAAVIDDTSTGILLESGGGHSPLSLPRGNVPLSTGFATGDTASTTVTYQRRTGSHSGHTHYIEGISAALDAINYGGFSTTNRNDLGGMPAIQVDLIIRDPKLDGGDTKIFSLPKNVIVFGANLPTESYSRTDNIIAEGTSATGLNLPLLAKHTHIGVDYIKDVNTTTQQQIDVAKLSMDTIRVVIDTNRAGGHNHQVLPITNLAASNRTGQSGYVYNTANTGEHSHQVEIKFDVRLKSKSLKAYVTKLDETPIEEGVILAYAIGPGTNYDGEADDSQILPPYWHFCDGQNGTPDLRDYYIYANFENNDHNVERFADNKGILSTVNVRGAGEHSHFKTDPNQSPTIINGTPIDVGGHDFDQVSRHNHAVSTATTFRKTPTSGFITNMQEGYEFVYYPPTVNLAFIMYNPNIR